MLELNKVSGILKRSTPKSELYPVGNSNDLGGMRPRFLFEKKKKN